MVKFKLIVKKFRILVLLVSALLFIILVPNIVTAQNNYKVVFDETRPFGTETLISETSWFGTSNFAYALQSNGFNVSRISDKPLSYEKLREYDVLIIISSNEYYDYSLSEINAIENFVKNGGGLLLAVQFWQGAEGYGSNRIAKRFGVSLSRDVVIRDSTNNYNNIKEIIKISDIKQHAITKNVLSFIYTTGTYIKDAGSSNVLANTSNEAWADMLVEGITNEKDPIEITGTFPVLSEMTYGKGRIVFMGSHGVFINTNLYLNEGNGRLGLNIVNWLANLPTTSIFIPPFTYPYPSHLKYRVAGIIIVTLLFFIGLIFKIRKDEGRKKPTTIKPIEKWKITALIIGHTVIGLWSLFLFLAGLISVINPGELNYNPIVGYMYLLISIPFCFITGTILYSLLSNKKLNEKYSYFNISVSAFPLLYGVFFWNDLFAEINVIGNFINMILIFCAPLSIPNFVSLRIIKTYGRELRIKEKDIKIPKPFQKALPKELKRYYDNAEYIGEGGFARVFRATRKDGKEVAVKIPKSFDERIGKLLVREVSNWSDLEHENIVKLYDFNIYPIPYLELELCDGSLECEMPIIEKAISVIIQIAKGLRYAHENKIIHGDIKPSNILIKDGKAKISDWGLSKVKRKTSVSLSGFTPEFAAPEQISSEFGKADERTDIYQLGGSFYWLVTGEPPSSKSPSEINPDSKCIEHIIMKCLKKRKEDRYQSINELLKELEVYKSEGETLTHQDTMLKEKTQLKDK